MLQIADTFGSLRHWSYASSLDNTINLSYQDLSGCSAHRMVCSALDCHYSTEAKETTALVAELQLPAVETKGASLWRWHRPLCYCWFLQTVPGLLHQLLDNFVIALCDKKLIKLWRVSYQFYFPLHHWGVTLIRSAEGFFHWCCTLIGTLISAVDGDEKGLFDDSQLNTSTKTQGLIKRKRSSGNHRPIKLVLGFHKQLIKLELQSGNCGTEMWKTVL